MKMDTEDILKYMSSLSVSDIMEFVGEIRIDGNPDEGCLFVYDKFPFLLWDKMDRERNQRKLDRHFSGKGD